MERAVPRTMESLTLLVDFVREFLGSESLSPDIAFDVDLVIEELFTNLVRHARGGGHVRVGLDRGSNGIRVRLIAEESSPFDPSAAPGVQVDRPLAERRPGGLGIHFVRMLCQQFNYEWRDGVGTTTVVMGVTS